MKKYYSLVFLRRGDEYLLARKSRKIGKGRWNGYGGKMEPNETMDECAKREVFEESGIICKELKEAGVFVAKREEKHEETWVHVFVGESWEGTPHDTPEMANPTWFKITEFPFENMLPCSWFWFPFIHKGKRIKAEFLFEDDNFEKIKSLSIDVLGMY
ncbi:8-oxo-dGTP diphosphatase / 2-hydroxy-dATP diphosphatase [Pancytospora epiphaga]|nr:8-oxo-dGTP diphosphatase / 2-hydroxy-dATP diphosphatase [Pancytospora epiphaga]